MEFKIVNLESVNNPNSVHGIYPYRGKISALDAEQIIKQMEPGKALLDPFCGSGTIVYEAAKHGLTSFGIDANPIAYILTKGKINIPSNLNTALAELDSLIKKVQHLDVDINKYEYSKTLFEPTSFKEILRLTSQYENMSDYLKACFLGAICLTARGCNQYKWTSSTVGKNIEPKRYINFYSKLRSKLIKHHYPIHFQGNVWYHDSRHLTDVLKPNSIDYVFTSPPYFDCLDYTMYYARIIYEILGEDRVAIRNSLIQNFDNYAEDMKLVLNQLNVVCKEGANIIFVVGDKKIHRKVINGAEFFNKFSPFKNQKVIERYYTGTSSQVFDSINKTKRKEQIIIWEK